MFTTKVQGDQSCRSTMAEASAAKLQSQDRPAPLPRRPIMILLLLCALLGGGVGITAFERGTEQLRTNKADEKATVMALISAFFTNYSKIRGASFNSDAPVPATFRAHSIETFNANRAAEDSLRMLLVGYPGREIRTVATDEDMIRSVEALAGNGNKRDATRIVEIEGEPVLRTIYPSLAKNQACVDCHNKVQTDIEPWKLNDLMGAFVLDAPVGAKFAALRNQATVIGLGVFALSAVVVLLVYSLYYRRTVGEINERAYRRLGAAIDTIESGFALRDGAGKTILSNEPYEAWLRAEPQLLQANDQDASNGDDASRHRYREVALGNGLWVNAYSTQTASGDRVEMVQDISQRKQAELAMAASKERAERESEAKTEFLATMSHEIRTPMNGVLGVADLLMETQLGDRQKELVKTIRGSGEVLLNVINDILDFSKIEAGQLELAEHPFDLSELIDSVLQLMEGRANEKDLALTGSVAPDVLIKLRGDPGRLRQLLLNLVGNAIKFTQDGGVDLRVKQISIAEEDVQLRFEIHDSGVGISDEQQKRLFSRYFQADSAESTNAKGTGLGLAICKQLVTLMGGKIGVESAQGKGSVFWFEVPLNLERRIAYLSREVAGAISNRPFAVVSPNPRRRAVLADWGLSVGLQLVQSSESFGTLREESTEERTLLLADLAPEEANNDVVASLKQWLGEGGSLLLFSMAHPEGLSLDGGYLEGSLRPGRMMSLVWDLIVAERGLDAIEAGQDGDTGKEGVTQAKVLLAEDNQVNQMLFTAFLKSAGHEVHFAMDGREAVRCAQEDFFDLILMDVRMPVMDGLEATKAIRLGDHPAKDCPIIALTANAQESDRRHCLEAGMDDYLSKPTTKEELLAKVEDWMNATSAHGSEQLSSKIDPTALAS